MSSKNLKFRQIELVEAIATQKNISRAANNLNMTQPGLTRALQGLEMQLGVKLFDRLPGGLNPTVFAEPFLQRSARIRQEIQQTKLELRRLKRFSVGELVTSSGVMAAETWLHKAISKLSRRYPAIRVSLNQSTAEPTPDYVLGGRADIGLTEIGDLRSNPLLETEFVGRLECHFVCRAGHPLDHDRDPTIDELRRYPFAGRVGIQRHMAIFNGDPGELGLFESNSGDLLPAITISTLSGIIQIIRDNNAISIIPPDLIKREIDDGTLVSLGRAHTPDLFHLIGFVTLNGRPANPALTAFKEMVRQVELERQK